MVQNITVPVRSDHDRIRTTGGRRILPASSFVSMLIFSILLFFQALSAMAGDEEVNPSAYQIFDPVTGFTIDVEPAPDDQRSASPSDHTIVGEGGTVTQDSGGTAAVGTGTSSQPLAAPPAESPENINIALLTAGLLLLVVVAVVTLRTRKHGPDR